MNQQFLTAMVNHLTSDGFTDCASAIGSNSNAIELYTKQKYKDLEVWEELEEQTPQEWADMAYLEMGVSFARIFDAMMTDYDPLANYFTDREEEEIHDGAVTRTGSKSLNPLGSVTNTRTGSVTHGYNDDGTKHQGTTYDAYSDSDFKNISKNVRTGSATDTYNSVMDTTSYNGFSTTETYNQIADTDEREIRTEEHRSGNSGIFSKQDLTTREIQLRMRFRIIPTFVRMVVDVFNTGVYSSDG